MDIFYNLYSSDSHFVINTEHSAELTAYRTRAKILEPWNFHHGVHARNLYIIMCYSKRVDWWNTPEDFRNAEFRKPYSKTRGKCSVLRRNKSLEANCDWLPFTTINLSRSRTKKERFDENVASSESCTRGGLTVALKSPEFPFHIHLNSRADYRSRLIPMTHWLQDYQDVSRTLTVDDL